MLEVPTDAFAEGGTDSGTIRDSSGQAGVARSLAGDELAGAELASDELASDELVEARSE